MEEQFLNISDENSETINNNIYIVASCFSEYQDLFPLKINIDLGFKLVRINLSGQ